MATSTFRVLAVLAGFGLTACQVPLDRPAGPERQLIHAEAMKVPDACQPSGSIIVDFTVLAGGQTAGIQMAEAPECLRSALTAWVSSFRYEPASASTPASVEWLLVEARKGS